MYIMLNCPYSVAYRAFYHSPAL